MDFKRARTDEQKRQRLDGIVNAADGLLDRHAYRDITMAMIADELGFSRANLAHYVKTKEEIFLLLYLHDLKRLHAELEAIVRQGGVPADASEAEVRASIQRFAERLAAACVRLRNVGRIGALLTTIIETNVEAERLKACKTRMMELAASGAELLVGRFAFLSREDAFELVMTVTNVAAGLYPSTHPTVPQQEALEAVGFSNCIQDFETMLARFLTVQLHGYRALARRSD